MIRILTDSAADFSGAEARRRGVELLPLSIQFSDCTYQQEEDPGFHAFYRLLRSHAQIPSTSQASPEAYVAHFRAAREAGDEIVAITLSSGLSSTHQSGLLARKRCGAEGIFVVDGASAVMGQRILVERALKLRDEGKSGAEIERELISLRDHVRIYGLLETLEYLKKGGRVPPSAALLGSLLNIKPVVIVRGGLVGMAGKARGSQAGIKQMLDLIDAGPGIDSEHPVYFGYTDVDALCLRFRAEAEARYGLPSGPVLPIGGVIGTHVGPGVAAIAYVERH